MISLKDSLIIINELMISHKEKYIDKKGKDIYNDVKVLMHFRANIFKYNFFYLKYYFCLIQ